MIHKSVKKLPAELPAQEYKMSVDWPYCLMIVLSHIVGIYGFFTPHKPLQDIIYIYVSSLIGLLGVNCGAHRLFTHKTYKANAPLRILLIAMQTLSMQRSVFTWVSQHRLHHKYMDTNADPHNSRRGLFFSHMGWLMLKPHPDIEKYSKIIDVSDLKADPYVMFQYRYYIPLIMTSISISTLIPYLCWGESLEASFFFGFFSQYGLCMHITWLVNSAAHRFGSKPYDVNLSSTEIDVLSFLSTGEGFHNYHHAFPWDYKAAELGNYSLNFSKAFIDTMAKIGWATDLKTVSNEMIQKRILRTGGTDNNNLIEKNKGDNLWGWDDPEMSEEDKKFATVLNKTLLKF